MSDFERWEARFAQPGYLFGKEPSAFVKNKAHLLKPGQKALALADGEGRNGVFLAGLGLDVLSVDISPAALAKARALAKEHNVTLHTEVADLNTWNWPVESFDVVVAVLIQFSKPEERVKVFANIKRALKPGGLLLMQGFRTEQIEYKTGGPPNVEQLYTRELLEEAFKEFSSLEIKEHDSVIQEGTMHAGMAALIDLVGRK